MRYLRRVSTGARTCPPHVDAHLPVGQELPEITWGARRVRRLLKEILPRDTLACALPSPTLTRGIGHDTVPR